MIPIGSSSNILVGDGLVEEAASHLPAGRSFVVSDRNVADAGWVDRLCSGLDHAPLGIHILLPGESEKTMDTAACLLASMLDAGIRRTDHVIALGGGVVGDIAGFAAAIVKRGCPVVQVPTTLLAQADSAVGGKTGVNTRHGKNQIGAFHEPAMILIDPGTLETLPRQEFVSGYAEVVKYGLISSSAFFASCEASLPQILARDRAALEAAITESVKMKLEVVREDPRDRIGKRALLNFGHTFGHAIEISSGIRHGEAVALGMSLAFRLSVRKGLCEAEEADRAIAHLRFAGLPTSLGALPHPKREIRDLLALMRTDKKARFGRPQLILVQKIGAAFLSEETSWEELERFLEEEAEPELLG